MFLINQLPSPNLHMESPFFCLFGKHPDYSTFRVLGCKCFPYLGDYRHDKLSPKSLPCVFIVFNTKHKGYKCLYPPTGQIYISRHVVFDEEVLPFTEPNRLYEDAPIQGELCTFRAWMDSSDSRPSIQAPLSPHATTNYDLDMDPRRERGPPAALTFPLVSPQAAPLSPLDVAPGPERGPPATPDLCDTVAPSLDVDPPTHGSCNDISPPHGPV